MTWNDLPKEIQEKMLERQGEQNGINPSVFEKSMCDSVGTGGFNWGETQEGWEFWAYVLNCDNHDLFFEKYPKENNAAYLKLQKEFDQYKKESIKWGVEDFLNLDAEGYHITPENAQKALERMIEMHDAEVGINWEVVRFWFSEYCSPIVKYCHLPGTGCYKKQEKDRTIFVGSNNGSECISIVEGGDMKEYYVECTEAEFIAAYTKVKQLLNDVQI